MTVGWPGTLNVKCSVMTVQEKKRDHSDKILSLSDVLKWHTTTWVFLCFLSHCLSLRDNTLKATCRRDGLLTTLNVIPNNLMYWPREQFLDKKHIVLAESIKLFVDSVYFKKLLVKSPVTEHHSGATYQIKLNTISLPAYLALINTSSSM